MDKKENKHVIENANIKDYMSIPGLNDKIDFSIPIVGNGMQPKYSNGDILLCKKATNDTIIQWGKPYAVLTKDNKVVARRLMPSSKEGYVNLATYSDDKPPFELAKDQIVDYYIVIASVSIE